MKFRSKIVDIEAYQVVKFGDSTQKIPHWFLKNLTNQHIDLSKLESNNIFSVLSREGWVTGTTGDWIIKGLEDEIYICKDSVFKAKYEPI